MGTEPTGQDGPEDRSEPGRDEWDDLVLDENFVRGAEVSESAARTRMLAERWKDGAPEPQPWRSDEPPAGWIHSSGGGEPGRNKRRARPERQRKRRWFRRRKGKDGTGD